MKASCDDLNVVKQENMTLPWGCIYVIMDMVINEKNNISRKIKENNNA